ncbi:MAG: Endo-beta-mannanase-like protein [Paenibacillaceae bacterium]|jgi:hypothetical protein|nr:Endo-beta-mannanase-like protein [Paenibacillaceae bacterium]
MNLNRQAFAQPGEFAVGCNYWASHAGIDMWSDWNREAVEQDLQVMAEAGITWLRIFPLWPVFQPVAVMHGFKGERIRQHKEGEQWTEDWSGSGSLNEEAFAHFGELVRMAQARGMKLIVGLITGWMSGKLYAPQALLGRNLLTDPYAIQWQVRFARQFVSRFREEPAIVAWDLGNECNCMGEVATAEEAWNWSNAIAAAIRTSDGSRPVISGMHSLKLDGRWTIRDQAELTDVLTTHTYPVFTAYCDQDPLNTMRTVLHPAAETLLYRGIGGKPCFVEEVGTLGPMYCSGEVSADYVRSNLWTLWAHDCRGFLWWCAFDQGRLQQAPYDLNSRGSEYGFFTEQRAEKPEMGAVREFQQALSQMPFGRLPERITDGVCLLSHSQDHWGAAYSAFVLAKQAGLDLEYRSVEQPLPDAPLYLLPCINGANSISRHRMTELLQKVEQGAILYISMENGYVSSGFTEYTGIRVVNRQKMNEKKELLINGVSLPIRADYELRIEVEGAEILARDSRNEAVFTRAAYGAGSILFLNAPLETCLARTPGVFHGNNIQPYWHIYKQLKDILPNSRAVAKSDPEIAVTEHPVNDGERIIVAVNYGSARQARFKLEPGWAIGRILHDPLEGAAGEPGGLSASMKSNDALVFTVVKA